MARQNRRKLGNQFSALPFNQVNTVTQLQWTAIWQALSYC